MKVRLLVGFVACLMLAEVGAAQDATVKEVKEAYTKLKKAFNTRDAETIRRLVTKEHIAITPFTGGFQNLKRQLKTLPQLKFTKYEISKLSVRMLDKNTALINYFVVMDGTYLGKSLAGSGYVSSLWVKQKGTWKETLYQQTNAKKSA